VFTTKVDIRVERIPITKLYSDTFRKAVIIMLKTILKAVLSASTDQYNG
jgi:hypothetical protein